MSRGFALSLDALLSIVILSIFIIGLAYFSSQTEADPFTSLVLKKQASDTLLVLDKNGQLSLLNSTQLNSSLTSILPSALAWNLTISEYNNSDSFRNTGTISLASSTGSATAINANNSAVSVLREFVIINQSRVAGYGTAELKLWAK